MIDFAEINNQYGAVAVRAVELVRSSRVKNPKYAWDQAASEIIKAKSSKEKGCPKAAFLGLCEEGCVKHVASGKYSNSEENRRYALKAVQILKNNPELSFQKQKLWDEVMKLEGKNIQHNGQMDVVVALWNKGLIDV